MSTSLSQEEKFWQWFSAHSDEYHGAFLQMNLNDHEREMLDELHAKLREKNPNLVVVFGSPNSEGVREFIISADGRRSAIPAVLRLVEAAPKFEKWRIIAFRPRTPGVTYEANGVRLSPDNVYFVPKEEGDKTGLALYLPKYDGSNDYGIAAFILLDGTIGEYDVMTQLGSIEFKSLEGSDKATLQPLKDLPAFIDAQKSKRGYN